MATNKRKLNRMAQVAETVRRQVQTPQQNGGQQPEAQKGVLGTVKQQALNTFAQRSAYPMRQPAATPAPATGMGAAVSAMTNKANKAGGATQPAGFDMETYKRIVNNMLGNAASGYTREQDALMAATPGAVVQPMSKVAPHLYEQQAAWEAAGGVKPPMIYDDYMHKLAMMQGGDAAYNMGVYDARVAGGARPYTQEELDAIADPNRAVAFAEGQEPSAWDVWWNVGGVRDAINAAYAGQANDMQYAMMSGAWDNPESLVNGNMSFVSTEYLNMMLAALPEMMAQQAAEHQGLIDRGFLDYVEGQRILGNPALYDYVNTYYDPASPTPVEDFLDEFGDESAMGHMGTLIELDNKLYGTAMTVEEFAAMPPQQQAEAFNRMMNNYSSIIMGDEGAYSVMQEYPYDALMETIKAELESRDILAGYMDEVVANPNAWAFLEPNLNTVAHLTNADIGSPYYAVYYRNTEDTNWAMAPLSMMTEIEEAVFYYLANTEETDQESARAYLDALAPVLQVRARNADKLAWGYAATADWVGAVGSWVAARGANLANPVLAGAEMLGEMISGKQAAVPNVLHDFAQAVTSSQQAALGELGGPTFLGQNWQQWAYGAGTNMVDMGLAIAVGGKIAPVLGMTPNAAALLLMSGEAAASEWGELAGQDMATWEKVARAIGTGAIEALTEKLPLDAITGKFGKGWLRVLMSAGSEGVEEMVSELSGYGLDAALSWIAGHPNEIQTRMSELEQMGVQNPEEVVLGEVITGTLQAGVGGTLAGFAMGGTADATDFVRDYSLGRTINTNNPRGVNAMLEFAGTMAEGTESRRLANTLKGKAESGKVSSRKVGELFRALITETPGKYRTEIEEMSVPAVVEALEDTYASLGMQMEDRYSPEEIARAILSAEGDTNALKKTAIGKFIITHRGTKQVAEEFAKANAAWSKQLQERRMEKNLESVAAMSTLMNVTSKPDAEQMDAAPTAEAVTETIQDADVEAITGRMTPHAGIPRAVMMTAEDGSSTQGSLVRVERSGDALSLVVSQEGQEGETTVTMGEGVNVPDSGIAQVLAYAQQRRWISAGEVNDMLNLALETQLPAASVIAAYEAGVNAGFIGAEMPKVETIAAKLGKAQADKVAEVISMGMAVGASTAQDAEAVRKAAAEKRSAMMQRGAGSVTYMGKVSSMREATTSKVRQKVKGIRGRLTAEQNAAVDALGQMSRVLGVNIVLYESTGEAGQVNTMANGWFDQATRDIYIDLNSGMTTFGQEAVKFTILKTAAHELTHYIESSSAQGYAQLRAAVREQLEERGENYMTLILDKVKDSGTLKDRVAAEAEVIADACEMMLTNTRAITELANRNKGLAARVAQFIGRFRARVARAMAGLTATSREAVQLVNAGVKYVDGLQQAWDRALIEAANVEAVKPRVTSSTRVGAMRGESGIREAAQPATDTEAVTAEEMAADVEADEVAGTEGVTPEQITPTTGTAKIVPAAVDVDTISAEVEAIAEEFDGNEQGIAASALTQVASRLHALNEAQLEGVVTDAVSAAADVFQVTEPTEAVRAAVLNHIRNIQANARAATTQDMQSTMEAKKPAMVEAVASEAGAEALQTVETSGVTEIPAEAVAPIVADMAEAAVEAGIQAAEAAAEAAEIAENLETGAQDTEQSLLPAMTEAAQNVATEAYVGTNEETRAVLSQVAEGVARVAEERVSWEVAVREARGRQYQIRVLPNGKKYVENDRTVITGNNPVAWRSQIMDYINREIRRGHDVTFYGDDGELLTITEDTAGKARFRNMVTEPDGTQRLMYDDEYATKLRAESHIDELAQVSRGSDRVVKDTKNHPFAKDGFTYRTAYFKDASGYYRVTLSVGIDGEIKTIYNIGKLKAANFPVDEVRGAQRPNEKITANDSMPQTVDSVKQYSERHISSIDAAYTRLEEATKAWREAHEEYNAAKRAMEQDPEYERMFSPELSAEELNSIYQKLMDRYGVSEKKRRRDELDKVKKAASEKFEQERAAEEERRTNARIEKSGLTADAWRVKEAKRIFGTTPYFYDAGYMLQDGTMLNFSGEKGKHSGQRGDDHRAIGQVYANVNGSKAMLNFMHEGNIRIMAETPGLDIASTVEPTQKQYAKIKQFVREYADVEYMSIDFTDDVGRTAGNLEYQGSHITADRVVNDIRHYFETGELREQGIGAYLQHSERRATAPSLRETLMEMEETPDMTATEKELLAKYKKLVADYRELESQVEAQRTLAEAAEREYETLKTTPARDEYRKQKNSLDVLQSKLRRASDALYHAEKRTGFADLMNRYRMMVQAFNAGSTRTQAAERLQARLEEVTRMLKDAQQTGDIMDEEALEEELTHLMDVKKLRELARELKKTHHTTLREKDIRRRIAYLLAMQLNEGNEKAPAAVEDQSGRVRVNEVTPFLRELQQLVRDLNDLERIRDEATLDIFRDHVPGVVLSESDAEEIRQAVGMQEFRRVMRAAGVNVTVDKTGTAKTTADDALRQMPEGYYNSNFADINNPIDQWLKAYEIIKAAAGETADDYFQQTGEEYLAGEMEELMVRIEGVSLKPGQEATIRKIINTLRNRKPGEAITMDRLELAARQIAQAKKEANYADKDAVRNARAAVAYYEKLETQARLMAERENLQQMNDLLKSTVKGWFAERELMEERRKLMDGIRRQVHWMDIRIRRETDQRRIPEGLKPVVEEAVRIFGAANAQLKVFSAKELDGILRTYEKLKDVHGTDLHRMDDIVQDNLEDALENLRAMTEKFAKTAEVEDRMERTRQRVAVMQEISDVISMIRNAIEKADVVVIEGQERSLEDVTQRLSADLGSRQDYSINAMVGKVWEQVKEHARNGNLTPPMFFRLIGSSVLTELNDSLMSAQGKHARLFKAAQERIAAIKKAHNYYAWQNNAELEMTTWQGGDKHLIQLTPEEALSIWVTWKREHSDSDVLVHSQHLEEGGFNLARKERKVGKRIVYDGTPHKLSQRDFATIDAWLTDEMKAYAEDIVQYLSTDMAELGNEVSMQLFGIRKFTEDYYFPMKVKPEQLEVSSSKGAKDPGESNRIAHFGGTKRRVDQAKKALVIGGITEVASQHINEMLLYNTFAIPIESFNKVLNQTYFEGEPLTDEERKAGNEPDPASRMTLRGLFKQKLGDDLAKYMQTYIADLNGGLSQDGRDKGLAGQFLSLYKRSAVMASLSVAIQQPSAIVRAMYLVDWKYFVPLLQNKDSVNTNITKEWAQLTKYSNTALVKERGGFDMTSGRGLTEQLMGSEGDDFNFMQRQLAKVGIGFQGGAKQKAQGAARAWENAAGFLPGFMDQVTWTMMWRVVKAEVADKNRSLDKNSEAFLKLAAKRFDEVMNLTQVYDSTLVRSHNMRSKSFGKKMLTAFMAESTVTANMLLDAAATKKPKMIARAAVVFFAQAVFNAALKALWTAFRDDDEEKSWLEKYLNATGDQLGGYSGALNPAALIPGLKDLMALADGYDVERADMAVWSDLITEFRRLNSGYYDNRPAADMVQNIGGAVANLFGIPLKNVMRDVRTGANALEQIFGSNRETTWLGLAHDASYNFVLARDRDNEYYYNRLYEGLASGNRQDVEEVRGFLGVLGRSATTIDTGIRGVVKDKYLAGELTEEEAMAFLVKHGLADDDKDAYKYVDKWREAPAHEGEDGYTYSQYNNVYEAIEAGDMPGINAAVKELKEHGFLEDKETLKSTLRARYRDQYRSLSKTNKTQFANLQAAIVTALVASGVPRSEALEYVKGWLKDTEADKAKENKDK